MGGREWESTNKYHEQWIWCRRLWLSTNIWVQNFSRISQLYLSFQKSQSFHNSFVHVLGSFDRLIASVCLVGIQFQQTHMICMHLGPAVQECSIIPCSSWTALCQSISSEISTLKLLWHSPQQSYFVSKINDLQLCKCGWLLQRKVKSSCSGCNHKSSCPCISTAQNRAPIVHHAKEGWESWHSGSWSRPRRNYNYSGQKTNQYCGPAVSDEERWRDWFSLSTVILTETSKGGKTYWRY